MTAALIPFEFDKRPIRAVDIDGEPWMVGKDVAEALGYKDTVNALKQHCRGVVKHHPIVDSLGRTQQVRILSEPDVLRLIVSSSLPEAERFERWVFEEVLPRIRKTGRFGENTVPAEALNDPATLRQVLLGYTEKVIELEAKVGELAPKAAALDRIADSDGLLNPTGAAKALQIEPNRVFKFMRTNRWVYRRPGAKSDVAYQDKIEAGYLTHKTYVAKREDGSERLCEQVMVTPKGLTKLAALLQPGP